MYHKANRKKCLMSRRPRRRFTDVQKAKAVLDNLRDGVQASSESRIERLCCDRISPESAPSHIKKKVDADSFKPITSAQISGFSPRLAGMAAGRQPMIPKDAILKSGCLISHDQPKQKIISGAISLIQSIVSSELMLGEYRTGISKHRDSILKST